MTDQGFNTYFNLIDNFTSKFDGIMKRITSVTRDKYTVDFTVSNDAVTQTQGIGKKLQESVTGINNAVLGSGATDGILQKTQESANKTANSMTKVGTETSKSTSALDKMRTKMGDMTGLADKLSDKFGIFTATLTSGAVAGIAWLKAFDSASISESIYRKLERKNVDTERLQEFVAEASGMGYTTKGQRRDIADVVLSRTKMRSTQSEEFTLNIEKLYAQEEEYLNRMGVVSSADLADMLTRKTLGRGEKRILEDIGVSSGSVSSRARGVAKATEGATAEDLVKSDPLLVLNNRLDEFSSKMGKTMIEPMNMLLSVVIRVLDVIDRIPGAPNLVAIGMVLASAAGATSLLITVLSPLGGIYAGLTGLLVANTTATATNTGSQVANAGASNVSIIAKTRLAAANIYASVATRAHTLATVINRATAMASVGAIAALAVIHGVLTGSITLTTAATWALNVAMAVLDALNPFTYIIAGALILAGLVGLVAYKSGLLGTIWKDLSKIKFGKIFDDLVKGDFDGAWKRLSKGMAIAWEDVKGDITLKFGGNFETIVNYVRMLVSLASRMFPVHAKALGVLTDTQSVFGWMYSLWKSFWSWLGGVLNTLISAFPGGKKSLAKSEWEEAMEKSGITYSEGKYYQSEPTAITTWDDALKKWTNYEAGHGAEVTPSKDILALQARYEGEKGFIESLPGIDELNTAIDEIKKVFQGVSDSFDGFVDTLTKFKDSIVSQFSNFIKNVFPWAGGAEVTPTFEGYKEYVENAKKGSENYRMYTKTSDEVLRAAYTEGQTGIPQEHPYIDEYEYNLLVSGYKKYSEYGASSTSPALPSLFSNMPTGNLSPHETEVNRHAGDIDYEASKQRGIAAGLTLGDAKSYTNGKETISPKAWGTLDSDQKEHWIPQYAVGATFKKDGLFAGRVHAPEEIIPQATAQRGAGHGAEVTPSKDILALQARYEGEKGFFESLPGIDELNTTIDEIKKVFKGVSDSFDSFVDTLTKFKDSIVSQFSNFINKITNAVPWYNNEGGEIDKAKILDTLKSARTDDGERLFDFQDETLMAAIEEAITGVPQEVGNLTKPAKYARAVNKAKELINKPDYRTEGAAAPSTVEKLTGLAESLTSGGAELLTNVGLPTAVTTPTSPVYWNKMGEGITADEFTELSPGERTSGNWIYDAFRKILPESDESNAKSYTNGKETISPKAWGTLDSDQKEHWIPQYAAAPSTVEKLTGLAESLTSRGAELLTNVGLPTAVTTPTSPVYWNKMGEGITADEFTELSPGERTSGNWIYDAFRKILPESDESNAKSYTNGKETISPKAWGTLDSDQKEHWIPQYAVGATFKKDGLFAGRVHAPEEIIPQATAQRGAGPIARALDTLHGVTAGGRASSGSQKTEIHIHEHNDFSGMRVSSAIDVDKLMRDIERKIRGGSISAVRKQIEQGRT